MASSYSADLKLELMTTGEKAGLWGDITNTNLNILQQAIAGYQSVAVTNATTGTTFTFSNGVVSNGKNQVIDLTGTITTSVDFIVPDSIEKTYIVKNSTSGAHQVRFKTASGSGATFGTTDKGVKIVYSNGTNITDVFASQNQLGLFSIPQSDGSNGQTMITDGSGTLSFGDVGISTGKSIAMAIVFG